MGGSKGPPTAEMNPNITLDIITARKKGTLVMKVINSLKFVRGNYLT